MKRILTMIIALAMLGSMAFAGNAEQANTTEEEQAFEIIQNGSTGEDVRTLQTKLKGLGYQIGLVDGIFGPRTERGLRELQGAMGLEQTGMILSAEELDLILSAVKGDGVNMVWDGRFNDAEKYWTAWGSPTVCEIVEIDGQNWMHLISSGTHWEGLRQGVAQRNINTAVPELIAGQNYILSFTAFGANESIGKAFKCGIHNRGLIDVGTVQEQYWSPDCFLTEEPHDYEFAFTPGVDGSFNVMIGTGKEDIIEAWFTNIKLETGSIASEWSEVPALS